MARTPDEVFTVLNFLDTLETAIDDQLDYLRDNNMILSIDKKVVVGIACHRPLTDYEKLVIESIYKNANWRNVTLEYKKGVTVKSNTLVVTLERRHE